MALDSVRQRDARRQVRESEVRPRWASRDAVSSGGVMLAWAGPLWMNRELFLIMREDYRGAG